MLIILLFQDNY